MLIHALQNRDVRPAPLRPSTASASSTPTTSRKHSTRKDLRCRTPVTSSNSAIRKQAWKVLTEDIGMNIALPSRISFYEEGGKTKIVTALPTKLLGAFSDYPALAAVADYVDVKMQVLMHDAARNLTEFVRPSMPQR